MALPIQDYALIGDTHTAALVGRDGSIDWSAFPRPDSSAGFAALLGDRSNGRWSIAPRQTPTRVRRRYRPGTLILETEFETPSGVVRLVDFMPLRGRAPDIVRIVEWVSGEVEVCFDLTVRFDYGQVVPWVRRREGALSAIAGPDALCLRGDIDVHGEDLATVGRVRLRPGDRRSFVCTWFPSHEPMPGPLDPFEQLAGAEAWWREWSGRCQYRGPGREAVLTSLMVL